MSVRLDINKALKEWHDPASDQLFILNKKGKFKKLKNYTEEDHAVLKAILKGDLADQMASEWLNASEEVYEEEYEEEEEYGGPIVVQTQGDVFMEQFLMTMTIVFAAIFIPLLVIGGIMSLFN